MAERVSDEVLRMAAADGGDVLDGTVEAMAAELLAYRQAARALVEAKNTPQGEAAAGPADFGCECAWCTAWQELRALVQAYQEPTR